MLKFIIIPVVIMLSCGSTKTNQNLASADSVIANKEQVIPAKDSSAIPETGYTGLPNCIKNKIDSFKLKEPHERPQRVIQYLYKGKKVFYVVMPCCDFFNEVYDDKCNYLGAPDGGFTGNGDGKIPGFLTEAKSEKLVWGTPK